MPKRSKSESEEEYDLTDEDDIAVEDDHDEYINKPEKKKVIKSKSTPAKGAKKGDKGSPNQNLIRACNGTQIMHVLFVSIDCRRKKKEAKSETASKPHRADDV